MLRSKSGQLIATVLALGGTIVLFWGLAMTNRAAANSMCFSPAPVVPLSSQLPARLIVDLPLPEPLAKGLVVVRYRTEKLRIVPVYGLAALNVMHLQDGTIRMQQNSPSLKNEKQPALPCQGSVGKEGQVFKTGFGICFITFNRKATAESPSVVDNTWRLRSPKPDRRLELEECSGVLSSFDRIQCPIRFKPMFHMEHCVFAAFLSTGKDHRDCGRPCDRHTIELRDRTGALFPVLADTGCRNTVYNSVPQSAAEYVGRMKEVGLRWFRVDLLRETPEEVGLLLNQYTAVVNGTDDGRQTWKNLKAMNQLGVTRGTLKMV